MNAFTTRAWLVSIGAALAIAAGCAGLTPGGSTFSPQANVQRPRDFPTPTPAPKHLYVDHYGRFYIYGLPLSASSKPQRVLTEAPDESLPPQIAVSAFGIVALVTPTEIRLYKPPIVSLTRAAAKTIVTLTPAMTEIGPSGADLTDVEFDPLGNLWLFSGLGGEISELRRPINNLTVAGLIIPFGAPGTKTAAYGVVQGRFDVGDNLYVYGQSATGAMLFKTNFPYSKPLSPTGINVAEADLVDSSQFLPSDPNPTTVILGQYFGPLASPPPQQPPPQPVNVIAQFAEPLNPFLGLFPNAIVNDIVGALAADPPRTVFYTLGAATGRLSVYPLPLTQKAKPKFSIHCLAGVARCDGKTEHLFTAP
jgi:hypothetical protein